MSKKIMYWERTAHGDNIADQVQTDDAYGYFNVITPADVWNILDQLETHFMDKNKKEKDMLTMLGKWRREMDKKYPDILAEL